jgi:hypothetical protein
MKIFIFPRVISLLMKKQMSIIPLVAAIIFTIVISTLESAAAQNAITLGNACMRCLPTTGTNMTNATMSGNATYDTLSNPLLDKNSG